MPPVGYVVFAGGKAGIHCGTDENGEEIVAWIGRPKVVTHELDEKGDGTAGYTTQYEAPEDTDSSKRN